MSRPLRSHQAKAQAIQVYERPQTPQGQTRIVEGISYEVVFDGTGETKDWVVGWASSLAGAERPDV